MILEAGIDSGGNSFSAISFSTLSDVPKVRKVFVNNKTTVVLWDDATRTRSTCSPEDTFDIKIGLSVCLAKKLYGKKLLARIIKRAEVQTIAKKLPIVVGEGEE
jgi:hypothetical protein